MSDVLRPGRISRQALRGQLGTGEEPVVIDVRSQWEYRRGHVPGALHLPFWKTASLPGRTDLPAGHTIVLYCAHGPRAMIAGMLLKRAGLAVRLLDGHMRGWQKAGMPIETNRA